MFNEVAPVKIMSARKMLETKLMVIKTFVAVLIYDFSIKYCD